MVHIKKMILILVILFGVSSGVSVSAMHERSQILGGVSIDRACYYQNGPGYSVVLVSNNVTGWRCRYHGGWNFVDMSVNLNQECRREYGNGAYATYLNFYNPYSWRCAR